MLYLLCWTRVEDMRKTHPELGIRGVLEVEMQMYLLAPQEVVDHVVSMLPRYRDVVRRVERIEEIDFVQPPT